MLYIEIRWHYAYGANRAELCHTIFPESQPLGFSGLISRFTG
jgi:hypothetical protein